MKKILMTAKHLDAGGVETFITGIYPFIDKEKYAIDFLITRKEEVNDPRGYYEDDLLRQGAKIYRIASKSKNPIRAYMDLKKMFKEHQEYEIFHINDGGGAAFPLWIARKNSACQCIVHSHNASSKRWKQNAVMQFCRKYVTSHAKCICCSENAGNWMFGKKSGYEILHNGIDTERFRFDEQKRRMIREKNAIGESDLVIGHVGRFNIQKNHTFLVDIFGHIVQKEPQAKLLLVGTGELQGEIQGKVRELGLEDNVIFAGNTKAVDCYLAAMDVFLFPSLFEGFAIAHLEAQCNGLPCIMSDTISRECKVTDLVRMLSLDEPSSVWAEAVRAYLYENRDKNRSSYADEINRQGFDRKDTACNLMRIYEEMTT